MKKNQDVIISQDIIWQMGGGSDGFQGGDTWNASKGEDELV